MTCRCCPLPPQVWFKTLKSLMLGTVFEIFCERMGADLGAVKFMYKVLLRSFIWVPVPLSVSQDCRPLFLPDAAVPWNRQIANPQTHAQQAS